ncbi:MAG: hypothetical protein OJF51_004765 [Nitrospira sp.]|nr:MAG: hypothetical protein OJF51_004765 [Nitrospira sp.]
MIRQRATHQNVLLNTRTKMSSIEAVRFAFPR